MKTFESRIFLLAFALILLACVPLLIWHRGEVVLLLQAYHTPAFDALFHLLTALGNGIIFLPLIILFSAFHYRDAILASSIGLLHALLCAFFKQVIFSDMPRPKAFFNGQHILHQMPGITLHSHHAFPSGHTATAFAFALLLILIIRKNWTIILMFLAILIAISRIYIGQHFYADVVGGALIGTISVFIVFQIDAVISWPSWTSHGWLHHRKVVAPPDNSLE